MLTQAELKKHVHYDPDTGIFTRIKHSNASPAGSILGCNSRGYLVFYVCNKLYRAHRLAWLYYYGRWPEHHLDHINRIRSDNRIANLREVDDQKNAFNTSLSKNNTTGYIGVAWHKQQNKYRAFIKINYRQISLGLYDDPKIAHEAYLKAKAIYHLI
jgi:HNH endonuclease/AP2 domain